MTQPPLALDPVAAWRRLAVQHRPLAVSGLATLGLLALFIVGIVLDPRTIGGAPAWLKPTKFAISITVYTFTLLWLLGHVRQEARWRAWTVRAAGWVVLAMFAYELLAIGGQALRGVGSHFNFATPFDGAVYIAMGAAINVVMVATIVVGALLLTQRFASPAFGWALRWGVAITVLGMAQAFLMTVPSAQQLAGFEAGGPVTLVGAHSVGAPDGVGVAGSGGATGMPVTGWRTDVGDLRVGHFVGLHALQVLPLVGAALSRRRLRERQRLGLVHVAGVGYLGLTLLVTWQALRAQPLLSPDGWTLAALGALVLACVAASFVVLRPGRRAVEEDATAASAAEHHGPAGEARDAALGGAASGGAGMRA
jgi:hypothetical protein